MKRFLLFDANAIIHRAFHALPPLRSKEGILTNAVYGFCLILLKALNELKPEYLAVAFDSPKPTFRHKEFKEYKATRAKAPEELYKQFPLVKEILKAFKIPIFEIEGYEADDIIATLKSKIKNQMSKKGMPIEIIIVTGDLDTLQLASPDTKIYTMRKGLSDIVIYDEKKVEERYGFSSKNLPDYKGLAGDPSDNLPGVKGIGEKVASHLIKEYGDLENVYQNLDEQPEKVRRLLSEHKEEAFLSKSLANLMSNIKIKFDLKSCQSKNPDVEKVAELFNKLDFKTLLSRLPGKSKIPPLEKEVKTKADEIDRKLEPILREMEKTGVKIDVPYLKKLAQEVGEEIEILKSQIFEKSGGEFNLDSPRQLSQILFTRLGLGIKGIKKTKTGISTASSELLKMKDLHPVINLILKYRELSKLKNTYLDTLPNLVDKNQRIHTTYGQETETGRLNSKNPNLQNIPVKTQLGKEIRKAFVAQKGYKLLSADYSQIELRIVAHLSQDPAMLSAFKEGKDIHQMVCQRMGVSRRIAKVINYGIIYGISAHGLSETLGIPHHLAQNYIDKFFDLHPKLRLFIENCIGKAREKGYVESLFERRRYLPEINSMVPGMRAASERMAVNMPCQGTAADILKLAMIELSQKLKVKSKRTKMVLTVHDELVFEVPEEEIKKVAKIVKETMENVVKLDVPLEVEISYGDNWGNLKKF